MINLRSKIFEQSVFHERKRPGFSLRICQPDRCQLRPCPKLTARRALRSSASRAADASSKELDGDEVREGMDAVPMQCAECIAFGRDGTH
jgi:hypothetical protein